jgi:hypothetical protein
MATCLNSRVHLILRWTAGQGLRQASAGDRPDRPAEPEEPRRGGGGGDRLPAGEGEARFYDTKVKTAAFFFAKLLPQTDALLKTIQAGPDTLMAVEADAF